MMALPYEVAGSKPSMANKLIEMSSSFTSAQANLPQPQRGIAEAVDALAVTTLPDLQHSVKWGNGYDGVGDGGCFICGGFAADTHRCIGTSRNPAFQRRFFRFAGFEIGVDRLALGGSRLIKSEAGRRDARRGTSSALSGPMSPS
ncbi:hypothetical protein CTB96_09840 [Cryobacterium arcticum]|uniref:Uncharacterized protein n=1 Tax=Cryobacterium arcticum TaxID=670052 RepID=A0A317ZKJ1_9MICO|nr:hypothetical protein CTB96_09840 [Cryobacterium arcticum]